VLNDLHQGAEVGKDGTAHENGDLLANLDACVAGLPALCGLAHGFEKGEEGVDAQGRGDDGEGTRGGIPHILVHIVNIRPHGSDHSG
jgi:hypothetical protein